jgi:hypothetical protein
MASKTKLKVEGDKSRRVFVIASSTFNLRLLDFCPEPLTSRTLLRIAVRGALW